MRGPRHYLTRRHGDPPYKWMTVLLGWEWLGLAVFDVVVGPLTFGQLSLAVGSLLLGVLYLLQPRATRNGYRSGWLQGRAQMLASMEEASRRGLDASEWAHSQLEADMAFISDWQDNP